MKSILFLSIYAMSAFAKDEVDCSRWNGPFLTGFQVAQAQKIESCKSRENTMCSYFLSFKNFDDPCLFELYGNPDLVMQVLTAIKLSNSLPAGTSRASVNPNDAENLYQQCCVVPSTAKKVSKPEPVVASVPEKEKCLDLVEFAPQPPVKNATEAENLVKTKLGHFGCSDLKWKTSQFISAKQQWKVVFSSSEQCCATNTLPAKECPKGYGLKKFTYGDFNEKEFRVCKKILNPSSSDSLEDDGSALKAH